VGLADGVIEAAQGRRARGPRAHRCTGRSRTPPRQQKKQKTSKVVNAFNGEEKFPGFFIKKGFCFHSAKKVLRSTRQNFEYKCAPGSGAHGALKHVLVACRSLVSRNQKLETRSVFPKKKTYVHL
jgi:hypothetical protein